MSQAATAITGSIDSPPARVPPSSTVWAVSLAFWLVLLVAALLYGSVAVAPRLSAWIDIRHDYITNAHQLKALETEVDYLERVRDALRSDPEFVRRLSAASISDASAQVEVIPVSGSLIFGSEELLQQRMPEIEPPTGAAVVQLLASHRRLRIGLLTTASFLVVFGFTVLNGSGGRFVSSTMWLLAAVVRLPLARYRPQPDEPTEPHEEADA